MAEPWKDFAPPATIAQNKIDEWKDALGKIEQECATPAELIDYDETGLKDLLTDAKAPVRLQSKLRDHWRSLKGIAESGVARPPTRPVMGIWSQFSPTSSGKRTAFRQPVINFYERNFDGKVLCMLTLQICTSNNSKAGHIWPHAMRDDLRITEIELTKSDIHTPRNGMILLSVIEEAFDGKRCCFLYDPMKRILVFKVVDPTLKGETIFSSYTFGDYDGRPLHHPANRRPFLRILSLHARECYAQQYAENKLDLEEFRTFEDFSQMSPPRLRDSESGSNIPPIEFPAVGGEYYFKLGTEVKCRWSEDQRWYRGIVTALDLPNPTPFLVKWKYYQGDQWTPESDLMLFHDDKKRAADEEEVNSSDDEDYKKKVKKMKVPTTPKPATPKKKAQVESEDEVEEAPKKKATPKKKAVKEVEEEEEEEPASKKKAPTTPKPAIPKKNSGKKSKKARK